MRRFVLVLTNVLSGLGMAWPLVLARPGGEEARHALPVGRMLVYEAARVRHGRPEPLDGDGFVNAYAHFRLA